MAGSRSTGHTLTCHNDDVYPDVVYPCRFFFLYVVAVALRSFDSRVSSVLMSVWLAWAMSGNLIAMHVAVNSVLIILHSYLHRGDTETQILIVLFV